MITLGDEVEDTVTGFSGIAVGRHLFLHGVISITVQPIIDHYGDLPDSENFAETALKVIKPIDKPVIKVIRKVTQDDPTKIR